MKKSNILLIAVLILFISTVSFAETDSAQIKAEYLLDAYIHGSEVTYGDVVNALYDVTDEDLREELKEKLDEEQQEKYKLEAKKAVTRYEKGTLSKERAEEAVARIKDDTYREGLTRDIEKYTSIRKYLGYFVVAALVIVVGSFVVYAHKSTRS